MGKLNRIREKYGDIGMWAYTVVALGLVIFGFVRSGIVHDTRSIVVEAICVGAALVYMFFLVWRYIPGALAWQRNRRKFTDASTEMVRVRADLVRSIEQRHSDEKTSGPRFPPVILGLVADKDGVSIWRPGRPELIERILWSEVSNVNLSSTNGAWRTYPSLLIILATGGQMNLLICKPASVGRSIADRQYVSELVDRLSTRLVDREAGHDLTSQ